MKKALIAGAASLAVAAMPVVGVFAADSSMSQTDIIKVTIDSACSLATSGTSVSSTYTETIANDAYNDNIAGSTFTITCNDGQGWYLTAVGSNTDATAVNNMKGTKASSTDIVSLEEPSMKNETDTSNWAFSVSGANGATVETGFGSMHQIPTTATTIATGAGMSNDTKATVTATYGVAIDGAQAADTYTGKVTYTLGHPKSDGTGN